jgi:hypothetical protein
MTHPHQPYDPYTDLPPDFERHVARLAVVMSICGEATSQTLFEGETRRFSTLAQLARCDFWAREPGYLVLSLLEAALNSRADSPFSSDDSARLARACGRVLIDDQAELRRVALPGAPLRPYSLPGEINFALVHLIACGLVTEQPAPAKGKPPAFILETAGVAFAAQVVADAPLFAWYAEQATLIKHFNNLLAAAEANLASLTAGVSLLPAIKDRYHRLFAHNA